jgi:predicted RND superfamily exporter protein
MQAITQALLFMSTHKRRWVYVSLFLISCFAAFQIRLIQIDTDPENMLPQTHSARVFHNEVKTTFAMHDAIVVGAIAKHAQTGKKGIYTPEILKKIHAVTDYALTIDGVVSQDVMAFSTVDNITQSKNGTLQFSWLMDAAPATQEGADRIRSAIERLPLLYDTLAASSGNAAAIYIPINDKNESYRIAEAIRAFLRSDTASTDDANYQDNIDWHITGLPVAEDQFGVEMFIQMGIAAPAAGVMIFILLFVFFRNVALIYAPMIVAMATVIITMGALIGMGFTVHIMSSMIAIFLMPIAVVDSVHILSEFSDRYKPGENAGTVISEVVTHLLKPMLFTSLTSSAGFFSLMLTPIPPVQIFGAYIGFGILLAFVITLTFIPAYISGMSEQSLIKLQKALHKNDANNTSMLSRAVGYLRHVALNFRGTLLVSVALLSVISIWGITKITINDNPVRWFKADHEIRVADKALNAEFAGTYNAYLVFTDNQVIKSASQLLEESNLPSELDTWQKQTLESIMLEMPGNRLGQLSTSIDDALFSEFSDDAMAALDDLSQRVSMVKTQSQVFQTPEALTLLSDLQQYLSTQPLVGKSQSLSDVVKVVNRELRSGEDKDYLIPSSQAGVAQTLMQYQSSHRPQDLWHFVTPDYRQTLVWLQLTSGDNQDMTALLKIVDDYFVANPLPEGLSYQWAGKAYINVVWQENMVAGMLDSLLSAFVIVFVMMVLLFRSFIYGVLAMLPLTITITFIYGAIGMVGKDYDMPIAVLSALTLGLSVDFAIHFLARAREIYRDTGSIDETLRAMFDEPASAISRNALVIALGFTPLLFAPLVPYITVGVFLASIMIISALVTLLVLPAAMVLLKRWVFKES